MYIQTVIQIFSVNVKTDSSVDGWSNSLNDILYQANSRNIIINQILHL